MGSSSSVIIKFGRKGSQETEPRYGTSENLINCFLLQKILESKRSKLASQLDEAKSLKESIDRRSAAVSAFLHGYLGEEQFADYEHFVKMKVRLFG